VADGSGGPARRLTSWWGVRGPVPPRGGGPAVHPDRTLRGDDSRTKGSPDDRRDDRPLHAPAVRHRVGCVDRRAGASGARTRDAARPALGDGRRSPRRAGVRADRRGPEGLRPSPCGCSPRPPGPGRGRRSTTSTAAAWSWATGGSGSTRSRPPRPSTAPSWRRWSTGSHPSTPRPAPVEDCYAGLVWTARHAEELGIDPEHIRIAGSSAGGGLAAGTAVMAHDRGFPHLTHQSLCCPMLDDRGATPASSEVVGDSPWDRAAERVRLDRPARGLPRRPGRLTVRGARAGHGPVRAAPDTPGRRQHGAVPRRGARPRPPALRRRVVVDLHMWGGRSTGSTRSCRTPG